MEARPAPAAALQRPRARGAPWRRSEAAQVVECNASSRSRLSSSSPVPRGRPRQTRLPAGRRARRRPGRALATGSARVLATESACPWPRGLRRRERCRNQSRPKMGAWPSSREHCRNQSRNTMGAGPTSRVHVVSIFFASPWASIAAAATAVRAAHSRAGSQAERARRVAARGGAASWARLGGARETRAVRLAVSSARHAARGGRGRVASPASVDARGAAGDPRRRPSRRLSRRRVQRAVQSRSPHRRGWRCRWLDPRDDRPGGSSGASPEPGARAARPTVRRALSRSVAADADRGPLRPPLRTPQSSPPRRRVGRGAGPLLERSLVRRLEDPRATARGVAARAPRRPSTARGRHRLAAHDRLETPRPAGPRRVAGTGIAVPRTVSWIVTTIVRQRRTPRRSPGRVRAGARLAQLHCTGPGLVLEPRVLEDAKDRMRVRDRLTARAGPCPPTGRLRAISHVIQAGWRNRKKIDPRVDRAGGRSSRE